MSAGGGERAERGDRVGVDAGAAVSAGLTSSASRFVVVACFAFVVAMVGLSYAADPLYRAFCGPAGDVAAVPAFAQASKASAAGTTGVAVAVFTDLHVMAMKDRRTMMLTYRFVPLGDVPRAALESGGGKI